MMNPRFAWKIAAPMIALGLFLLVLGVFAAWNVHEQHQTSSELISLEVRAVIAIAQLQMQMREIRYQINIFLRTRERQPLLLANAAHVRADALMARVKQLVDETHERELIDGIIVAYDRFFRVYSESTRSVAPPGASTPRTVSESEVGPDAFAALAKLADETLTNEVLEPLRRIVELNEELVRITNETSRQNAHHLRIGFTLLGICGGAAGLLMGMGIARAIWRSIVQFDVSVRGAVVKLADVTGPVTFSHTGDFAGLDVGLRDLERHIAQVVRQLNLRETELLRSEQLASVGQLAAGMAHELRNPLTPMKMLVQAALERGDDAGLRGRALEIVDEEIGRLETSIQAFLDFARPPQTEKSPADLRDIVRQTLDLVGARVAKHGVTVTARLPGAPVTSRVDRTQLRQLLLNLVLNALDALPGGGSIDVELVPESDPPAGVSVAPADEGRGAAPLDPDPFRIAARRDPAAASAPARWFAIRVADDGPGIPPDDLDRIFEPFVTSKETGTGIGLSICRRIALAHQGNLVAVNRPEGGAEFVLTIPYDP